MTRNIAYEHYEDTLYQYKYRVFESLKASTNGKPLPHHAVTAAVMAFFYSYKAETYRSGKYYVNQNVLAVLRAELHKISKKEMNSYPWARMVKGVSFLIERKYKRAHTLIQSAVDQGLDNIIAFIALYIIKLNTNDTVGAELELENIERKDGHESPLVHVLRDSFETGDGTNCHKEHNAIEIFSLDSDSMLRPRSDALDYPDFIYEGYLHDGHNIAHLGTLWNGKIQEPVNNSPAFFALAAFRMLHDAHDNFYFSDEKRLKDAFENINTALTMNNQYAWAYYVRAAINCEVGQYTDALNDTDKAIELGLINSYPIYLKAIAYQKMELPDESLRYIKQAIRRASRLRDLAKYHLLRIQLLDDKGETIFNQIGTKEDHE